MVCVLGCHTSGLLSVWGADGGRGNGGNCRAMALQRGLHSSKERGFLGLKKARAFLSLQQRKTPCRGAFSPGDLRTSLADSAYLGADSESTPRPGPEARLSVTPRCDLLGLMNFLIKCVSILLLGKFG